jgi:NAD(P)-dependent dehydrogenase (short-subunit alcohol dehydrogenase family)
MAQPSRKAAVEQIRAAGGEAVANTDNVAEFQGAERLVETALDAFGGLDILVNNAGITNFIPVHELTERDWDRMMAVHLKGSFGTIRFASPIMCKQRSGVIINTGSESGLGRVFGANYCAAKEGIIGLTRRSPRNWAVLTCDATRSARVRPLPSPQGLTSSVSCRSCVHSAGIGLALAHPACRRWKCTSREQLLRW